MNKRIDSFTKQDDGSLLIEYDGWHFEAKSEKAVINKVIRYIFEKAQKILEDLE